MSERRVRVNAKSAQLECIVDGDGSSPVVLLVHGFPDTPQSLELMALALSARGRCVVRPFLRGYAPSSLASDGNYDLFSLASDLDAIASHFSPSAPVDLVGHDWGALIAGTFATDYPDRARSLVTLAVPPSSVALPALRHLRQLVRSRYIAKLCMPFAAARIRGAELTLIDELWRAWSPGFSAPPALLTAARDALSPPGHLEAALAYYRALVSGLVQPALVAAAMRPVACPHRHLHGGRDACFLAEVSRPDRVFADAGHFLHLECPQPVIADVLEFLES